VGVSKSRDIPSFFFFFASESLSHVVCHFVADEMQMASAAESA
jgi:hypothetical protein